MAEDYKPAFDALKIEHDTLVDAAVRLVEHIEGMYRKYARGVIPRDLQLPINIVKEQAAKEL